MLINQMPGLALNETTGVASELQSGRTLYNGDGELVTGTLSPNANTIKYGTTIAGVDGTLLSSTTTASASDILSSKTAYDNNGSLISGSMTNNGAYTATTSYQGTVTIPAGYHNGSGYIRGGSASYAGATIDASKVLSGYKGWDSSGNLITGSLTPSISFNCLKYIYESGSTIFSPYLYFYDNVTVIGKQYYVILEAVWTSSGSYMVDSMIAFFKITKTAYNKLSFNWGHVTGHFTRNSIMNEINTNVTSSNYVDYFNYGYDSGNIYFTGSTGLSDKQYYMLSVSFYSI